MIRNAKDLSPEQKTVVESLLGRRVLDEEEISIRAILPVTISDQRRRELIDQLTAYFAEVDGRRRAGSAEEAEEVLNEAIEAPAPVFVRTGEDRPRYDDRGSLERAFTGRGTGTPFANHRRLRS